MEYFAHRGAARPRCLCAHAPNNVREGPAPPRSIITLRQTTSMGWMIAPCLLLLLAGIQTPVRSHQLILASVLFRHGDRSPVDAYPKDKYQETSWPQGFGQLSTTGMRQHLYLGSLLRSRYVGEGLITPNYTRVQVYVRSTDYDRTLMSVESQLAGLFPPEGDQVFDDSIAWQPIPVHTVPQDQDILLRAYGTNCPRYQELREESKSTVEYKTLEKDNQAFFKRLEEKTGIIPTTLDDMWTIQDTLLVQNLSGLPWPEWLEPEDFEKMTELATYTLGIMFSSTEKSRLVAGNWVGKVVSDMKTRVEDPDNTMRLYLYSAHDTTVAAMTTALGVYNNIIPPYATALIIELYNDSNSDYWVSLYYRNDTNGSYLWPLRINSCKDPTFCSLQEFIAHTAPVIPSDWEKECGLTSSSGDSHSGQDNTNTDSTAVLGVLLALAVVVIVALSACILLMALRVKGKLGTNQPSTTSFAKMVEESSDDEKL